MTGRQAVIVTGGDESWTVMHGFGDSGDRAMAGFREDDQYRSWCCTGFEWVMGWSMLRASWVREKHVVSISQRKLSTQS